ncbi:LRC47 protein, partial [Atractosteus spatula]|nr:LRC47 protein [Atractosteus spatula]
MEGESVNRWAEIEKAEKEKRRELVLQGANIDKKIQQAGGLNPKIYELTLLNYLEISQCPSLRALHQGIENLLHLQSLILCRNKLSDIPKGVGSLKFLKVLDVSVNELVSLPDEVSQLGELTTLNISCNKIQTLPGGLSRCTKLSSINISKNEITKFPDDLYSDELELLSTIIASENAIEELSGEIRCLTALKNLDLSNNRLTDIPAELADCSRLKEINFRGNSLKDKRLEKMVNGCQTKSVLDYLRAGGRGRGKGKPQEAGEKEAGRERERKKKADRRQKSKKETEEEEEEEDLNRLVVRILHVSEGPAALTVKATPAVKDVRPYIVCCVVKGMNLKPGNALKRFLTAQIKLHDEICEKRTAATIATHDLQLVKGPLLYDARPPKTLKIVPLGRKEMKAADLVRQLQLEAEEQRKQKRRQNVSGLHKYLQLLDGKENYPCVVDADDHVISFPPITNSDKTKMRKSTRELFVEVTSSTSLQICKDIMDAMIVKMAELNKFTFDHREEATSDGEDGPARWEEAAEPPADETASPELIVQQVRIADTDGNLKVVYPSKTDLNVDVRNLTVIR